MKDERDNIAQTNVKTDAQPVKQLKKKKYKKPGVIYQAPLEAMAATCTGANGKTSGICGSPFS